MATVKGDRSASLASTLMDYRSLGRTGVKVSPLCLGAMMFGAWGERDHDESIGIIHRALDAGINFIDTADVYSQGESEEIVGKALAGGRRDDVCSRPSTARWGTTRTSSATRAAGSCVRSRTACAG
jgi:predicted aldo/keto reductase-like oxidoreductase